MKKFTKDDLRVNDIVTTRAGSAYLVHDFNGELFAIRDQGYFAFNDYNNDLTLKQGAEFDIVKVQRPDEAYQLAGRSWDTAPVIWKRKEVPLLSEVEYHILKNSSTRWKWIARDKYGSLSIHEDKPDKKRYGWIDNHRMPTLDMYHHLFSCIQWEDDEPQEIAKLLERYEEEHNHEN